MLILDGRRRGGDLLAFSPDGRTLAARSETGLLLWRDISNGAKPVVFRDLNSVGYLRFTPDAKSLSIDGPTAGILDVASGSITPFPERDGFRFIALASDGQSLVVVNLPESRRNTIVCWPAAKRFAGKPRWTVKLAALFAGRPLLLPDGRIVLAEGTCPRGHVSLQYRYVIRSGKDGTLLAEAPLSAWSSERDAVSPCGRWVAGQLANRIAVWTLNDLAAPPVLWRNDTRKVFTDLAFHPSGEFLAIACTDGTVRWHDARSWTLTRTFNWNLGKMTGIAFSGDGALAAAGSDTGKIVVWDVDG